jgi:hypothetical protein
MTAAPSLLRSTSIRVALSATAIVGAAYLLVAIAEIAIVTSGLTREIDLRLAESLDHLTHEPAPGGQGFEAPPGKRMGHAGAVISGGQGTAEAKMEAMREAGITVVDGPHLLGRAMKDALSRRGRVKPKLPAAKRPAQLAPPARKGAAPAGAPPAQRAGKSTKRAAKSERE